MQIPVLPPYIKLQAQMRIAVSAAGQSRCSLSLRGELRCKHTPPACACASTASPPMEYLCGFSARTKPSSCQASQHNTRRQHAHTTGVCVYGCGIPGQTNNPTRVVITHYTPLHVHCKTTEKVRVGTVVWTGYTIYYVVMHTAARSVRGSQYLDPVSRLCVPCT